MVCYLFIIHISHENSTWFNSDGQIKFPNTRFLSGSRKGLWSRCAIKSGFWFPGWWQIPSGWHVEGFFTRWAIRSSMKFQGRWHIPEGWKFSREIIRSGCSWLPGWHICESHVKGFVRSVRSGCGWNWIVFWKPVCIIWEKTFKKLRQKYLNLNLGWSRPLIFR